ncbi:MAG: hypothetical protein J6L47_00055 [Alphaproteobacteria bacterium]|nr:hypothetical protein [Alphaproteobacteria bacterium]
MRRRATIKAVYTMCEKALGGKQFGEYTPYDRALRFQRSTLLNCYESYKDYMLHQSDVLRWIKEFEQGGDDHGKIVADTWRWVLEINKELPVRITKQR